MADGKPEGGQPGRSDDRKEKRRDRLLRIAASNSKKAANKTDELCERLERVEIELMGEMGNADRPSIRERVKACETYVDQHKERDKIRSRWLLGLVASAIVLTLPGLVRAISVASL